MKKSVKLVSLHSTMPLLRSEIRSLKKEKWELLDKIDVLSKSEEESREKLKRYEI